MNPVNKSSADINTPNRQQLTLWQAKSEELIFSALQDWAIIFLAWWAMSATESIVITVASIIVIAGRLHALGAVLHDACHVEYRHKTIRWYLVEILAGWPVSSTTDAMRYHHLRHHRYTGTLKDPYLPRKFMGKILPMACLYARGLLLPTWWTIRPVVGLISLIWPQLQPAYARLFLQDRSGQKLTRNSEVIKCAKADIVQLCAHITVLAIVLVWQLPFLSFYLIPLHVAGILNARRVAREHPSVTRGELIEQLTSAHRHEDFTMSAGTGWMEKWFLSPHNLGLHIEHHRYPGVAFRHLPKVQAMLTGTINTTN